MDNDGDMIRVVERRCGAIERGVIEIPLRRSDLPDQLGKIAPVFVVSVPAAFRGKIKLGRCRSKQEPKRLSVRQRVSSELGPTRVIRTEAWEMNNWTMVSSILWYRLSANECLRVLHTTD
jgi:hypothetical protein